MTMRLCIMVMACLFAMSWLSNSSAEQPQICTQEEAKKAESLVSIAASWDQSHQQFKHYAHCDDGAIAEGFSESVSVLLAEHWPDIQRLGKILESDSSFRKFIIRHIDETIPADRLSRIAKNADERCPRNLKGLCREISAATSQK